MGGTGLPPFFCNLRFSPFFLALAGEAIVTPFPNLCKIRGYPNGVSDGSQFGIFLNGLFFAGSRRLLGQHAIPPGEYQF